MNILLSKSAFMLYLECPIALWIEKVRPELRQSVDSATQRLFDEGNRIDELAQGLYPGGVVVAGFNKVGHQNTEQAIASGATILYQPTVVADRLACRADILTKNEDGSWDIHEVKASTKVKDEYVSDLTFQRICFERVGMRISRTFLIHVDNTYVRKGAVDIKALLAEEDITDDVNAMIPEVEFLIPEALQVLDWPKELETKHVEQCPALSRCEYVGLWLDVLSPKKRKSFLSLLDPTAVASLLENQLVSLEGLPKNWLGQIGFRTDEEIWPSQTDSAGIREELAQLEYPLHFYDYETYSSAVPPFDGYRPYQQIPFQFSVYVMDAPDATPKQYDFLLETFADPALPLITALREAIGPTGTVISWNAPFEKGRNEELAKMHPEHAEFLRDVNERTFDLMLLFKKNRRLFIHPGFRGSASLKAVMPTLVPDLSYKNLNIQEGRTASASWPALTDSKLSADEKDQLYRDMIEYCRLDVYGMVRILEVLRKVG